MKKIFFALTVFLCCQAFQREAVAGLSAHIALTTVGGVATNIATTYNGTYPQLAIASLPAGVKSIYIFNNTSFTLAFYVNSQAIPSSPPSGQPGYNNVSGLTKNNPYEVFVPAFTGLVLDNVGVGQNVYMRTESAGSTLPTSGDVFIDTF